MIAKVSVVFYLCLAAALSTDVLEKQVDDGRIVGGENTTIDQHPYMLSLQYFGNHQCGASILSSRWVLTAAHCFGSTGEVLLPFLTVRAGTSFHRRDGQERVARRVIRHEDYSTGFNNDIALVELEEPLEFNDLVQPISLPTQDQVIPIGVSSVVIGWGKTMNGDLSDQLQEVTLSTLGHDECAAIYRGGITPQMLCAHERLGGKDSCNADSGGPLTWRGMQIGIVSWGPTDCGSLVYPGVYTRVTRFITWIHQYTQPQ